MQAARVAVQKGTDLDDEMVEYKEIDGLLSEIAGLAGRWGLFGRFIIERLRVRTSSSPGQFFSNPFI